MNIEVLIKQILSDKKLSAAGDGEDSGVYRDVPIITTASRMNNYIPKKYVEMREIARSAGFGLSDVRIFYEQAVFMQDYEDDYEYRGEFFRYYPKYSDMSLQQLRGYFSWRTRVRRGEIEKTSLSFVFVYIYELLNLIGVSSPQEGFVTLRTFWEKYRELDNSISRYVKQWLLDLAAYYCLDKALIAGLYDESFDKAVGVLINSEKHTHGEVFSALSSVSSYNIEKSAFYKKHAEDCGEVAARVFVRFKEYYNKKRKISLCDSLFGVKSNLYHSMFNAAVFYDLYPRRDIEYVISPSRKYSCRAGLWMSEQYYSPNGKSTKAGDILRLVDYCLRRKTEFKPAINPPEFKKVYFDMVNTVIDDYFEEKREAEKRVIKIDLSALCAIRSAALVTQEKLTVDEERDDSFFVPHNEAKLGTTMKMPVVNSEHEKQRVAETQTPSEAQALPKIQTPPEFRLEPENQPTGGLLTCEQGSVLDETETAYVRLLFSGTDGKAFLSKHGLAESVVVESVNEKLYDIFGDIVIDYEGDCPVPVEDYADELKGIVSL